MRWGILSTADIALGEGHPGHPALAARCEVVAIASRDGRPARRPPPRRSASRAPTARYEALLADPDVDAVYIPLPNHLHAEWTIAAARAGKHVLCEKPLALTAAEAQEMVDACRDAGVLLMEAFMYRLHPSWIAARELVAAGRIGRLQAVDSWFSYFNDDPANIRNMRRRGRRRPVRHRLLLREPLADAVRRRADARAGGDHPRSGPAASTRSRARSSSSTAGSRRSPARPASEPDQRVDIYGTEGRISIQIPFNIPPDRPTRVFVTAGGDPPVAPATETLDVRGRRPVRRARPTASPTPILDGAPLPVEPADAVANLRVIEAIFAAGG